ncbi:SAF domain-containing protein [Paenibacillus kandeliae]|uniref:SAF domain-containing protein n=1 Tax=Paenibacillus kandeliae TaxID=3231269 RepID=UPI00345A000C
MSRIRLREKKLIFAGLIGAVSMLVICLIAAILYTNQLKNRFVSQRVVLEQELSDTQKQLSEETIAVPVVNKDIQAGEKIVLDQLTTVQIPKTAVPDGVVMDLKDLDGKIAKINLPAKSPVTSLMVFDDEMITNDERNQEFSLIELPLKLQKDQYVDVRIKFPSGQDYIVLTKKKVEDLSGGTVWYHMNEKEILNMSSAIVDAYMNDATIYALSYIEPGLQEKSTSTYAANKEVLDLMDSDPNIVEKATSTLERTTRQNLEKSLNALTPADVQKYKSAVAEERASAANITTQQDNNGTQQDTSLNSGNVQDSNMSEEEQIFTDTTDSVSVK